ncbi:MAG: M23 family metallopeptidase [Sphingomonas sp.]
MPVIPALPLTAALLLLGGYGPATGDGIDRLPGGEGATFRQRMMTWSTPAPARQVPEDLVPAALPRLSSGFGYRHDPIRGGWAMHSGIDIPGPLHSPVMAAAGGVVDYSGSAGGYGNMIEIDHGNGLVTRYAHLSRSLVRPGVRVEQGETIAMMGSTGRSTGSHLHFEVRVNGQATAPLAYFSGRRLLGRAPRQPAEPHVSAFARARTETAPESTIEAGF